MNYLSSSLYWNMHSRTARRGMKQAANDYLDGLLPDSDDLTAYVGSIQAHCYNYQRPSAWWRGYLLVALAVHQIDISGANAVSRALYTQNLRHEGFPSSWLREVLRVFSDPILFVIEAAELPA